MLVFGALFVFDPGAGDGTDAGMLIGLTPVGSLAVGTMDGTLGQAIS